MKFDAVIIGGGLSGLACGISLAEAGKRCAIVSSGQGALHFSCGSFDLLGYVDGEEVKNPLETLGKLPQNHPYSLVGAENVKAISALAPAFFEKAGVKVNGNNEQNHNRLTPVGNQRPTWLTIDEYITLDDSLKGKKVLLLNVAGYLDMPVKFIASGLEKQGVACDVKEFSIDELDARRESASEMRSVNIAKVIDVVGVSRVADAVNEKCAEYDVVLLPAVFGWNNNELFTEFKSLVKAEVKVVATLPPSVPGVRLQTMLRKRFQQLGGVVLLGDSVTGGKLENGKLEWVKTNNLEDEKLIADTFVLATGTFFSRGIAGAPHEVYEPVFGLDVDASQGRETWYNDRFFGEQPYMKFGVATDNTFLASKGGKKVENLYVAGSVLSGANQVKEASIGGVSLITGLHVANLIKK